MKILTAQAPTAEQLRIIGERRPGVEIIRGAAGSGKTTTALLRLKNLAEMFKARQARLGEEQPVRILVLTYNRTLSGYVQALATEQATAGASVDVEVDTFAHWAREQLGQPTISDKRPAIVSDLMTKHGITLPLSFVSAEIEYILGRFPAASMGDYITKERTGRGGSPRMDRTTRTAILGLITDYKAQASGSFDWDDIAILMGSHPKIGYDIAIIDEAQDFSANQIRAVLHHLNEGHALTLVIDTMQRLYPRGYNWAEAGIDARKARFHRLQRNHRNTFQIAQFAKGILEGLAVDDDGTLPDLDGAKRTGPQPTVIKGRFSSQAKYAVDYIKNNIDLASESVAFLHPLGGRWFDTLRHELARAGLAYAEISRQREWPDGPENIALCTMHSAKGLEFDHVIVLGLSAEVTQHGPENDDHQRETLRRLLAMAVARARSSVVLGYKPGEASTLVGHFMPGTFVEIDL